MYSVMLVASLFLLNSCGDDESPSLQFKTSDGQTINLKGAKLFLAREDDSNNHKYRDYFISDGELAEGEDGWSLSSFTGATYYFAIELAVPAENDFASGDFPQLSNWGDAEDDANISYIYLENEDESYYSTDSEEDQSLVKVSGGFDDGDKMTLKFKGKLSYYYYDNELGSIEEEQTIEFYYSGRVVDKRIM